MWDLFIAVGIPLIIFFIILSMTGKAEKKPSKLISRLKLLIKDTGFIQSVLAQKAVHAAHVENNRLVYENSGQKITIVEKTFDIDVIIQPSAKIPFNLTMVNGVQNNSLFKTGDSRFDRLFHISTKFHDRTMAFLTSSFREALLLLSENSKVQIDKDIRVVCEKDAYPLLLIHKITQFTEVLNHCFQIEVSPSQFVIRLRDSTVSLMEKQEILSVLFRFYGTFLESDEGKNLLIDLSKSDSPVIALCCRFVHRKDDTAWKKIVNSKERIFRLSIELLLSLNPHDWMIERLEKLINLDNARRSVWMLKQLKKRRIPIKSELLESLMPELTGTRSPVLVHWILTNQYKQNGIIDWIRKLMPVYQDDLVVNAVIQTIVKLNPPDALLLIRPYLQSERSGIRYSANQAYRHLRDAIDPALFGQISLSDPDDTGSLSMNDDETGKLTVKE